jgi:phage tail-like protein
MNMKTKGKAFAVFAMLCLIILIATTIAYTPVSGKKDPLPSSNFVVEIDGIATASFTSVEGVYSDLEVVEYRLGTEDSVVHKVPGNSRAGPLILKRPLDDNDELWDWFEENRDNPVDRRNMSVIVLDHGRSEQVRFNLKDCWPSEYYVEPLESNPSDVAIEVIVIQYEELIRA